MSEEKSSRTQSTVQFPYTDIDDGISVARGLLQGGGMPLSRDQLAAALKSAPNSGSFAVRLGTARAFQLMESKDGKYQLTELGFEIVDASRQKEAMVKAFLAVELYKKVYDEFRGKLLPPRPHGLEAAFVNFGVSPKQKERARSAFDKSARIAGFFPNGNEDRLVMPFQSNPQHEAIAQALIEKDAASEDAGQFARGLAAPVAVPVPGLHPSIVGMLAELPAPKSDWSKQDQADWLQALATMFRVIYKTGDGPEISVQVMRKILPKSPEDG